MSQIGINIKKLRKVKGLSQQAFSDLFSLTRGNISSYEEGRAEPRIEVVLRIAKYFSIPVAELLERQLTVNEILNFGDHFVSESAVPNTKDLTSIPYLNRETLLKDGSASFSDWHALPQIYFPIFAKHPILAIEYTSDIPRPIVFPFEENAILFFEQVDVEILHTLDGNYGFFADKEDYFFGQYSLHGEIIELKLSNWKKVAFSMDKIACFYKLYGKFEKVI